MLKKIFYEAEAAAGAKEILLSAEESKHAAQVLRIRQNDEVEVLNGKGLRFLCEVENAHARQTILRVVNEKFEAFPISKITIALAQLKKRDRMEWFIEKAVELGAAEIIFFNSRHSEKSKLEKNRVEKIAISAMKQSGNAWLPEIKTEVAFKKLLDTEFNATKMIAHCHTKNTSHLKHVFQKQQNGLILIGPEGDFSVEEVEQALHSGYKEVNLGHLRLRAETAAIFSLICMQLQQI